MCTEKCNVGFDGILLAPKRSQQKCRRILHSLTDRSLLELAYCFIICCQSYNHTQQSCLSANQPLDLYPSEKICLGIRCIVSSKSSSRLEGVSLGYNHSTRFSTVFFHLFGAVFRTFHMHPCESCELLCANLGQLRRFKI